MIALPPESARQRKTQSNLFVFFIASR